MALFIDYPDNYAFIISEPTDLMHFSQVIRSHKASTFTCHFFVDQEKKLQFSTNQSKGKKPVKAITAGTAHFENGNLTRISNEINGAITPFDSLQLALYHFFKTSIPMTEKIEILKKKSSSEQCKITVAKKELFHQHYQVPILNAFHKRMALLNSEWEYRQSLQYFRVDAIQICKTDESIQDKKSALKTLAHERFNHRHSSARVIADVLMCISQLWIFVGTARVCSGRTFFFSTSMTTREESFQGKLTARLDDQQSIEELLFPPMAFAS